MPEFTAEQKLKLLDRYMGSWINNWPFMRDYSFDSFVSKASEQYAIKHEIRQKKFCVYCERPFAQNVKRTRDHIIPLSLGGSDDENNLVAACYNCNQWKGNKELRHWITDLYLMKRLKMGSHYYQPIHIKSMISNVQKIMDLLKVKPSYLLKKAS